jgi:hypothetical protein
MWLIALHWAQLQRGVSHPTSSRSYSSCSPPGRS